jgi:hypothetical protein
MLAVLRLKVFWKLYTNTVLKVIKNRGKYFFHDLVELKTQQNHLVAEANQEKLDYIALRCRLASHLNQKLHKNQSLSERSIMTK